jgi:hypothetical protein
VVAELWTPKGSTLVGSGAGGRNAETGASIVVHTFRFHDKETGRSTIVKIPADPSISQAHIEDMAAQSLENWLAEVRAKGRKRKPTPEQRKEIGRVLNEFRQYTRRRRQSSSGVLYFKGVN